MPTFCTKFLRITTMIGENRQLVTNEPVEVQDCRKITHHFRGIYGIYPHLVKEYRRMSTWNRLDLQTQGSHPVIMPKNLPDYKREGFVGIGSYEIRLSDPYIRLD